MAKIGLTAGFSLIPEGTHVFRITGVKYKEDFGKMEVSMEIANGQKHTERFSLLKNNGEVNEGGMNAFSYFAKAALNDFSLQEIDEQNLVGHFIRCEVTHTEPQPNINDPSKTVQFVRLGNKEPADGFDIAPVTASKLEGRKVSIHTPKTPQTGAQSATEGTAKKALFDLNSILG